MAFRILYIWPMHKVRSTPRHDSIRGGSTMKRSATPVSDGEPAAKRAHVVCDDAKSACEVAPEVVVDGEDHREGRTDDLTTVYSDGACKGNPGIGGFGAIAVVGDGTPEMVVVGEWWGGEAETTNNRMEMSAAAVALEGLGIVGTTPGGTAVCVRTDSRYVLNGMTRWVATWREREWHTASGAEVKNVDLWKRLVLAVDLHTSVRWEWVKGHSGDWGNERADELANHGVVDPAGLLPPPPHNVAE